MPSRPMFDWHGPLCQLLMINEDSSIDEDAAAKLELAESIEETLMELYGDARTFASKMASSEQTLATIRARMEMISCTLGSVSGRTRPQLAHVVGSKAITNGLDLYLEKNKDVAFLVYRNFECCNNNRPKRDTNRSGKRPAPTPADFFVSENVSIVSDDLRDALSEVCKEALGNIPGPLFVKDKYIKAPFFWWYHHRNEIEESRRKLDGSKQELVSTMYDYIIETLGPQWLTVDSLLAEGGMEAQYIDFLFVRKPRL
ncbi:hypothetical protein DL95DRAFT_411751 [Leptodontidium sp. 2 PMI_412]|nr:hypothetical protein DL95DRAFT_411751 [Leptodontidium sp. 2 PMI_412]